MGRRKISIQQIKDPKLRLITFHKRKKGLIKKAAEMSLLCNVNLLLIFEDGFENLIQFSNNKFTSMEAFLKDCKYNNVLKLTSNDYPKFDKMTRYRNTVSIEGQEKLSYEDEMKEREISQDSDSDENNEGSEQSPEFQKKKTRNSKKNTKKNKAPNPALEQEDDHNLVEQEQFLVKDEFHSKNPFLKTEYDFTPPPEVFHNANAVNLPRGLKDKKGIETINARMLKQIPFDKAFLEQRIGKPLNTYSATMENLSGFIQTINTFPTYEANNSLQNIIDCGQQDLPLKNPEIMNYLFSKERGIINQEEDLHSKMQNLQNMYGNPYFEPTKLFTGINQPIFQNGLYKFEGRNKGKELVSENGLYYESQNHGVIKGETGKNENIGVFNANSQVKYENTHELGLVQDSQIKVEEHVSNNVIINHYENIARNKVMLENTKKKIKMV